MIVYFIPRGKSVAFRQRAQVCARKLARIEGPLFTRVTKDTFRQYARNIKFSMEFINKRFLFIQIQNELRYRLI